MNIIRDCPSPGDSATDLTGTEEISPRACDSAKDQSVVEEWSPILGDDLTHTAGLRRDVVVRRGGSRQEVLLRRQRLLLIVLASYASAATIALVYLLSSGALGQRHELESLPDVAPLNPGEFRYVPASAALPAGHRLRLGDSRRFGDILVEPYRITRGPVEFVHFSGQATSPPPERVTTLKLWVRLTNLSTDQRIVPLDRTLLFKRDFVETSDEPLANNVIHCRDADGKGPKRLYMLDVPPGSDWNLKHQPLDVRLDPGESLTTFLPSQADGIHRLEGEIIWRMHLRKGYHAPTGHGVTTLVEVAFDHDQIELEHSAEATSG